MTMGLRQSLDMILGRRPPAMQVGAICVDPANGKVLLITSRGTGRWIIPKGWPMSGKSLPGAAAVEAWEEAGVTGRIDPQEMGRYRYDKVRDHGFGTPVEVRVFRLDVQTLKNNFPERAERERAWYAPAEAARLVAEPGLSQILSAMDKGPRA
ncbi:NUDIX hydrolase (plasmid) [Paracoccus sp. TK19116]|uniref:NUDIX hydrolase n=1 Tax=Paracoccus albicereus TaxID=2922394 RepID=A0ABT1MLW7_9RHOB|nr:NUDIX hydrolase [Paracoccus albicereus]MCQ0969260.1 NUDIX hydrolase [Paracoccus albicereus]